MRELLINEGAVRLVFVCHVVGRAIGDEVKNRHGHVLGQMGIWVCRIRQFCTLFAFPDGGPRVGEGEMRWPAFWGRGYENGFRAVVGP